VQRDRLKKVDVSSFRIPGTKLQGWRAVAVAILGLYILLFLILNNRSLEVDFVFFSVKSNELLALVVLVVLSFVAGFVIGRRGMPASPPPPTEPPRGLQSGD
jgi:uncharacterized integral membrane protein